MNTEPNRFNIKGTPLSRRQLFYGSSGLALTIIGGQLLSACGSDSDDDTTGTGASIGAETTSGAATPTAAATPDSSAPASTAVQRATVAIQSPLASLDPPLVNALPLAAAVRHMIQSFVEIDGEGAVTPTLAESWEVAADQQTWTMFLREGVKFHDGSAWSAEVAKMNLDRYLGSPEKFPRAQQYAFMDKVTVVDDLTLEIHTATPHSGFINWTSYFALGFHSGDSLDTYGDDVALHGVGTGPFQLVEFTPNERLVMKRFDDYWGPKAKLDEVTVQTVPDAAGRVAMLESGEAQFVNAVPATMVPVVEGNDDLTLLATPSVRMVFIGINSQHQDLQDVRVRQAFNYAVDAERILATVLQGRGTLAESVMPEMLPGYAAQEPYGYDPDKAAALLDEAGWTLGSGDVRSKDGRELRLVINTTDGHTAGDRSTCESVQAFLADVGVAAEINVHDQNTYFALMQEEKSITESTLNYFGFGSNIVDPTHALNMLEGSWSNINSIYARYRSAEFDEAYQRVVTTVDDDEGLATAAAEAQEIAWKDAPWIFLFSLDSIVAHSNSLVDAYDTPHEFWNLTVAHRV